MNNKKTLTVVVPCYNEEESVKYFYYEMKTVSVIGALQEIDINILFVNDGSDDDTLNVLKKLVAEYENVSYISLSINFGKESALYAGLENSKGDYVAIMDADLQDPPRLLE
jgi:glucosyltransferase